MKRHWGTVTITMRVDFAAEEASEGALIDEVFDGYSGEIMYVKGIEKLQSEIVCDNCGKGGIILPLPYNGMELCDACFNAYTGADEEEEE